MIAGVLTISATAFAELALTCNKIWHNKQGKWLTQGSARRRTFARCTTVHPSLDESWGMKVGSRRV